MTCTEIAPFYIQPGAESLCNTDSIYCLAGSFLSGGHTLSELWGFISGLGIALRQVRTRLFYIQRASKIL